MKQTTSQVLYAYWNELRAGRLAPQRLEIEPARIAGILSETFMLERAEGGAYTFRLAGTRLCELFGSELRGSDFLAGWSARDRSAIERHLAGVCEMGAAALLTFEGSSDIRHRIEVEALLLPLLHAGKTVARIIGTMSAASTPRWLNAEPLRTRRLIRQELIWPDGRPHSVAQRMGRPAPQRARLGAPQVVQVEQRRFRVYEGGRAGAKDDKR